MTETNKENLTLENYENEFLYKENKSNLNISFNRIAFIFFIFIMICFIYSLKVFYLGSLNFKLQPKKIEKKIYNTKENLRGLKNKYEMVLMDFNYLTTPEKLMEYQSRYFENELKEIDITNLKKITLVENEIKVKQFIGSENE